MAYANLLTREIVGAKDGTLTYFHELSHLNYENKARGRLIRTFQEFTIKLFFPLIVFAIVIPNSFFNILLILNLATNIISEMFEEIECWLYAKKKIREYRDDSIRGKQEEN